MTAYVAIDGVLLNEELLKLGYAWCSPELSEDDPLHRLEAKARSRKTGLWRQARQMPPWQWRQLDERERKAEQAKGRPWHQGGTLYSGTLADWRAASKRNRLATCADYVLTLGNFATPPPDWKDRSIKLESAISLFVDKEWQEYLYFPTYLRAKACYGVLYEWR